jgi:DNA processing protein
MRHATYPQLQPLLAKAQVVIRNGITLYCIGDLSMLDRPTVAVVGSRAASELGVWRARRLARELVDAGVVVVSGLARGIDAAAHTEALACGGGTVAVLGTPLDQAYPAEHEGLQALIAKQGLVVSPFAMCSPVERANFPRRNAVMAALSQASVIVEAANASGTVHQARACRRLHRHLFICASLAANPAVTWHKRFVGPRTHTLTSTQQVLEVLGGQSGVAALASI